MLGGLFRFLIIIQPLQHLKAVRKQHMKSCPTNNIYNNITIITKSDLRKTMPWYHITCQATVTCHITPVSVLLSSNV